MSVLREGVPLRVSALLDRPARWAPSDRLIGDYDGRERTLEVFLAEAGEQRAMLQELRADRAELERVAGGPITIIFHTRRETNRLYPEMLPRVVLRGLRSCDRECAIRVEPVPRAQGDRVRVIHGSLEATLEKDAA